MVRKLAPLYPTGITNIDNPISLSLTCNTPGVDDHKFTINNNNELTTTTNLIYDEQDQTNNELSICIKSTDSFNQTLERNFKITLNRAPELLTPTNPTNPTNPSSPTTPSNIIIPKVPNTGRN